MRTFRFSRIVVSGAGTRKTREELTHDFQFFLCRVPAGTWGTEAAIGPALTYSTRPARAGECAVVYWQGTAAAPKKICARIGQPQLSNGSPCSISWREGFRESDSGIRSAFRTRIVLGVGTSLGGRWSFCLGTREFRVISFHRRSATPRRILGKDQRLTSRGGPGIRWSRRGPSMPMSFQTRSHPSCSLTGQNRDGRNRYGPPNPLVDDDSGFLTPFDGEFSRAARLLVLLAPDGNSLAGRAVSIMEQRIVIGNLLLGN